MMDGISAAASVIAVIQISEDVVSLCSQYLKAVKNAKSDIVRLQDELGSLKQVLEGAQKLLEGPNAARLETSRPLLDRFRGCYSQLKDLETKLKDHLKTESKGKGKGKGMRLFGLRALKWPFKSKEVDNVIQSLNKFRDTLSASLNVDQTTLIVDSFERVNDEERFKILEWISPIQYGKHHDTVKEARTSNTCEWLLQDERFRNWEDASSSVILWLQGSPGAGKTFLTSRVIDHVQSRLRSSLSKEGFAFFYCNRNEEERRKPLSVLRSYARQLSTAAGHPEKMRKKLHDSWRETTLRGSDLGFEACHEQLLESVNLYPRTTLVLDALDECEPDSRRKLVNAIKLLLSKSERPLKVFISSRPNQDIRSHFISEPNVEIQARHNEEDIRKFIDEEIINHESWRDMSPSLQEEIIKILFDRSQGMFQWVNLQIKQILKCISEQAIRNRLGKLPRDLKEAYDEIYNEVKEKDEHDKALADRAFMWVMCACKPLSSDELISAIRPNLEKDAFNLSDKVTESQLLHLCNNLLVLDSQRNVWRFSHLSVTEYFENNHWDLWQAHCYAAKICLGLLIETYKESRTGSIDNLDDSHDHKSKACDIFDPKHSFQSYSRYHWVTHIQTQEEQKTDPVLVDLLKSFLGSPGESSWQYRQWYLRAKADGRKPSTSVFSNISMVEISPETSTVFAMCRFSFYALLADWWRDAEIPLLQTNSEGDSLLTLAAAAGCRPICEVLIKRGVQVNLQLQTGGYGSALAAAAAVSEHTEIIKYLVEQGADVNLQLQTGGYGSALAAAVWGRTETVKYLVEQGADINLHLQTGEYGSALVAAACTGRPEIVKYLVEQGADVNLQLQTGVYGSALAAAAWGRTETVKYLVEQGADVNLHLQTGEYGSALAAAAALSEHTETVKHLVEQGANVNLQLQTGDYGSALVAAACTGRTETVKYLIEQGADVNLQLQAGRFGSALAAAAYWGWKRCAKSLMDAGANVNLRLENGLYSTALHASQADVSQEDLDASWWDSRGEGRRKRDKAEVLELLQRKAQ
ncbi:hypothetical protein B0O99DRAFT_586459 [Bisporella sp. PMI_857]|nr:hypothetical protein B0O99DRAFT_586459 [Bisporella sp. PMI_857]